MFASNLKDTTGDGRARVGIMVSALALLVMIFGFATSMLSLIEPWFRRKLLYFQFHQLGMDDVFEKVARVQDHAALLFDIINFLIGIGIIVIAIGLIRRREWARRAWIWVSGLLVVAFVVFAVCSREFDLPAILAIVFRSVIFVVSLGVLTGEKARSQFAGGSARAATA